MTTVNISSLKELRKLSVINFMLLHKINNTRIYVRCCVLLWRFVKRTTQIDGLYGLTRMISNQHAGANEVKNSDFIGLVWSSSIDIVHSLLVQIYVYLKK